jgi:succinylglutamate desuccinylase
MREHWPRVIGTYGGELPGPLLIVTAAIHGNEWTGLVALERLLGMLQREPQVNPGFRFRGLIAALSGNLAALPLRKRFLDQDMNRLWMPENIARMRQTPAFLLQEEERQVMELLLEIEVLMARYPESPVVLMDLHTTTADGGIFSIATGDPDSLALARAMHAPVILGMLEGIEGTTMHYFNREVLPREVFSLAFESGQHDDPLSVDRAVSAMVGAMRALGMVRPEDVESEHDRLLIEYSRDLPAVSRLIGVHRIRDERRFRLHPGFRNFQPLRKGQLLGYDQGEPLFAPEDCLILMPRYQTQGDDGYFLLRVVEP